MVIHLDSLAEEEIKSDVSNLYTAHSSCISLKRALFNVMCTDVSRMQPHTNRGPSHWKAYLACAETILVGETLGSNESCIFQGILNGKKDTEVCFVREVAATIPAPASWQALVGSVWQESIPYSRHLRADHRSARSVAIGAMLLSCCRVSSCSWWGLVLISLLHFFPFPSLGARLYTD